MTIRIGVILASVRQGRRGERFSKWVHTLIAQRRDVEALHLDLKDYPIGPYTHEQMPSLLETSYADEVPRRWSETIHSLDGYVMVTPEYNHSFPGNLKNAIDHVSHGWWYKPVGFVSYGGTAGGARAVDHLRSVVVELRMVPIRQEVNVRLMGLQLDEAGHPSDALYARTSTAMIDQLLWWARASKQARAAEAPPAT